MTAQTDLITVTTSALPADIIGFKVKTPEGEGILPMSHGLTDRWGEINDFTYKTGFVTTLLNDDELRERLISSMVGEESFVTATLNGWALHVEKEYYSIETCESEDFKPGKTYAEVEAVLIDAIPGLRGAWPDVTFCVGDPEWTYNGRPCLWAIVEPGRYTAEQLRELLSQFPD